MNKLSVDQYLVAELSFDELYSIEGGKFNWGDFWEGFKLGVSAGLVFMKEIFD